MRQPLVGRLLLDRRVGAESHTSDRQDGEVIAQPILREPHDVQHHFFNDLAHCTPARRLEELEQPLLAVDLPILARVRKAVRAEEQEVAIPDANLGLLVLGITERPQ